MPKSTPTPSPIYMECVLRIDTSDGWQISLTKVLGGFEDLSYQINPSAGVAYVKGKADPKQILLLLKKGGQHATLEWISHGISREDKKVQNQGNGYNNNHMMIPQDPFYHGTYPYPYDHNVYHQFNHPYPNPHWYNMPQNAHQFNHPNPNWYNMPQNIHQFNHPNPNRYDMPQNAYPYGNHHGFEHQHGTRNMFEGSSFSSESFDSHGPMRSNNHQFDPGSSSQPYIPPGTDNQTDDQPAKGSSLLKKIAAKLCFNHK